MKKIIIFIFLLLLSLTSCKTEVEYTNELKDNLLDDYKLILPFSELESIFIADCLYFNTGDNLTLEDMKAELEAYGYVVENARNYSDEDCLIINLYINNKKTPLFMIDKEETKYRGVSLVEWVDNVCFSFPCYFIEYPIDFEWNDDCLYKFTANTNKSFDDFINFYENSLGNIYNVNNESKSIIIQAIDKRLGDSFNALVKIVYVESSEGNYIEVIRLFSAN